MQQEHAPEKLFYISDLIKATGLPRAAAHRLLPRPRFAFTAAQFEATVAAVKELAEIRARRKAGAEPSATSPPRPTGPALSIDEARKVRRIRW